MKELQPHQQRVIWEQAELAERIQKLTAFINSDRLTEVDPMEQKRLVEQLGVMTQYNTILTERIEAFGI